jgi:hypothetical protein
VLVKRGDNTVPPLSDLGPDFCNEMFRRITLFMNGLPSPQRTSECVMVSNPLIMLSAIQHRRDWQTCIRV